MTDFTNDPMKSRDCTEIINEIEQIQSRADFVQWLDKLPEHFKGYEDARTIAPEVLRLITNMRYWVNSEMEGFCSNFRINPPPPETYRGLAHIIMGALSAD